MTATSATIFGTLYIVATPIGNRDDISFRALHVLQSVDVILAENPRHSKPWLTALGVKKPLVSLHAHNEASQSQEIIQYLLQGKSMALISDAGTPLMSDPGFPLVKLARSKHLSVVPIPGACAFITALSAAGVPCDTFTFAGFLPAKRTARRKKLECFSAYEQTLVFYESTHRIKDSLDDLTYVFGGSCEIVLAKELTKTFERFVSGSCTQVKNWLLTDSAHLKGEFVLIIPPRKIKQEHQTYERLLSILLSECPLKQAVKIACQVTGASKNEVYNMALKLSSNH